jgi:hypothetical protein
MPFSCVDYIALNARLIGSDKSETIRKEAVMMKRNMLSQYLNKESDKIIKHLDHESWSQTRDSSPRTAKFKTGEVIIQLRHLVKVDKLSTNKHFSVLKTTLDENI